MHGPQEIMESDNFYLELQLWRLYGELDARILEILGVQGISLTLHYNWPSRSLRSKIAWLQRRFASIQIRQENHFSSSPYSSAFGFENIVIGILRRKVRPGKYSEHLKTHWPIVN